MLAAKRSLVLAVSLLTMAAGAARTTGIARVSEYYRYPGKLGLVRDKTTQLEKSPVPEAAAEAFPNRALYAVPDTLEVFQDDAALSVFGFRNEPLTDPMILYCLESALFAGHAFQPAFSVFRPLSLVLFAASGPAPSVAVNIGTGESFPGGIGSKVDDPKVYAQPVGRLNRWRFIEVGGAIEIEFPVPVDEIGLPTDAVKAPFLVRAKDVWHHLPPALDGQDGNAVAVLERQDSFVIGDGTVRPEHRTGSLVTGKYFAGFPDGSHGELSRQSESLADSPVGKPVDRRLTEHASIESLLGGERSGFVETPHCIEQQSSLLLVW